MQDPDDCHERDDLGLSGIANAVMGRLPFPDFVHRSLRVPVMYQAPSLSGLAREVERWIRPTSCRLPEKTDLYKQNIPLLNALGERYTAWWEPDTGGAIVWGNLG